MFTVTLPLKPDKEENAATDIKKSVDRDILKGMNIMLVDDNELNREIMYDMLSACGATVIQACDGKEAVDKFTQSRKAISTLFLWI